MVHPAPIALSPEVVAALRDVIEGPLLGIAERFSRFLADVWPHTALVIFTRECTGRPRKVSGDPEVVGRVSIAELEVVRDGLDRTAVFDGDAVIAGRPRRVWAIRDTIDTLLVVVPKHDAMQSESSFVQAVFGIVAVAIRHQVEQASPDYLAQSRAASSERARTIVELTDTYIATLESLLATLRTRDLDDRRARLVAIETASAAVIALRSAGESDRMLAEEAVTTAFARLRGELSPLLEHRPVRVDYVEPPADGRALPGEVAHAARAVVRSVVLEFTAQPTLDRIRIAWGCDGGNLLVEIRDDGVGAVDTEALRRQLAARVDTLAGRLELESVSGWGSRVSVAFPLDPVAPSTDVQLLAELNPREVEVLHHLAAGRRNRVIAEALGISESTVKFHVAAVLRKLGVASRGEAGALAREAGIRVSDVHSTTS